MDTFIDLSWRLVPASAIMAIGALLVAWGLRQQVRALFFTRTPDGAIGFVHGIRRAILGLAIVGLGASRAWQLLWLFVLSLAFLGEEALETSVVLWALKGRRRQQTGAP